MAKRKKTKEKTKPQELNNPHDKLFKATFSMKSVILGYMMDVFSSKYGEKLDLETIEPFTLILLEQSKLVELRWDGNKKFKTELHSNKNYIWSSATLYSKEVVKERERLFAEFLAEGNPVAGVVSEALGIPLPPIPCNELSALGNAALEARFNVGDCAEGILIPLGTPTPSLCKSASGALILLLQLETEPFNLFSGSLILV